MDSSPSQQAQPTENKTDSSPSQQTQTPKNKTDSSPSQRNPILTFFYGGSRDVDDSTRNVLLVAATLIAAATFQAGVNPPGGVWQDSVHGHYAGRAIYAQHHLSFAVFLICNTFAFSTSIHLMLTLMVECRFFVQIFAATTAMFATYWSSIYQITPGVLKKYRVILAAAVLPYVFQVSVQLGCSLKNKLYPKK